MIGVVGAGAFGTALAVALSRKGPVRLWARDEAVLAAVAKSGSLPRLPGIALPPDVHLTAGTADLADCETLLLAVPMQRLAGLLPGLADLAPAHVVAACKGIDLATLRGPTAVIAAAMPRAIPAILSGPSFASDIARGLPTALSLGCREADAGVLLQSALSTPTLRLYRTTDTTGVELGGALKNVIAIACGAVIGAGLGESARAALMTRGMAEIMRLAGVMGADRETLMGLSGLGDLALTCASPASRNFALGLALGQGRPAPDATTEGVATAQAALAVARAHDIDLPITQVTAALVAGDLTVKDAMTALLTRTLTTE